MKICNNIYILGTSLAFALFSACDDIDPVYTVGEADNAIRLEAGIVDGGSMVKTRAGSEDSHATHGVLNANTQLRLQVSGTWTGHKDENDADAQEVVKVTTASISDGIKIGEESQNTHNKVNFSANEQLYWDDYGTADPNNKNTGRLEGLTIYAVATNGVSSAPVIDGTTGKKWNELSWTLDANQKTNDWATSKDLLISNNVSQSGVDGCYKFDERATGKLLVFTHAMSKITINLKANNGFPTTAPSGKTLIGNTPNKFENNPEVKLLTRDADKNEIAYAITKGTVNVTTGVVIPSSDNTDKGIITAKLDHIHDTWAAGATEFQYTVQMTALVVPGTLLGASGEAAKAMTIAKISVDGNDYYVNAEKISAAIGTNGYKTEPGKNYILNITVDKTEVHVNATVANWIDVTAETAAPKIEVTTTYGETSIGNSFDKNYSFYLNDKIDYTAKASNESADHYYGALVESKYEENRWRQYSPDASTEGLYIGNVKTPLYWPNHTIKYFFRGVWPRTITAESEDDLFLTTDLTTGKVWKPSVVKFTDNTVDHQGIYVKNVAYQQNTFPSDLMIGIPLKKKTVDNQNVFDSDNHDEPDDGISATEGAITLNFTYRMAQVEVHLLSSGLDTSKDTQVPYADNIDLGSYTGADQAKVEISGGYKEGYVLLADGGINSANFSTDNYEMTPKSIDKSGKEAAPASYNDNFYYRHDAVIPQSLGTDSNPLQFVITTGSNDLTYDTYKINIKDIYVTSINNEPQPANTKIDKWEAGKHYVYTLKITKTQIKIEAKITDWIPVVAGGNFWL